MGLQTTMKTNNITKKTQPIFHSHLYSYNFKMLWNVSKQNNHNYQLIIKIITLMYTKVNRVDHITNMPHRYRNTTCHMVSQCYLPPGRGDTPAFTQAN